MPNRLTELLQAPWIWAGALGIKTSAGANVEVVLSDDSSAALVQAVNAGTADERGETPFVVWSNEHRAWWGPGRRGYTTELARAGCYSMQVATQICFEAGPTSLHLSRSPAGGGIVPAEIMMRLEDARRSTEWLWKHNAGGQ